MSTEVLDAPAARHYGFSALLSGFARMWRGWRVALAAVVGNAVLQAVLILSDPVPGVSLVFGVLAAASFVVLMLMLALVTASALEGAAGPVRWGATVDRLQAHGGAFLLWFVLLLVAVLVGLMLRVLPGLVVLLVTPYLLLAVLDGRPSPLAVNLRVIGARWGRWLVTALIMAAIVAVSWLLGALSAFFITGAASSFITWMWFGFLAWWFQATWALVYRSTPAGSGATPAA